MCIIEVQAVRKSYKKITHKVPSSKGEVSTFKDFVALQDVSFRVEKGEIVGLLGPNGAGKTTLLKVLAGLLRPDAGAMSVLGVDPSKRNNLHLRKIAMISGQRRQLTWDLPAVESFLLIKAIYAIPDLAYQQSLQRLCRILEVGDLLHRPVKKLSLGQRMRLELVASLLHSPELILMDEPTLGLDFATRSSVWKFVRQLGLETRATIFITSHYIDDIEAMASRVIVLDGGGMVFDGPFEEIKARASQLKILEVEIDGYCQESDFAKYGIVKKLIDSKLTLAVPAEKLKERVSELASSFAVLSIAVETMSVEAMIGNLKAERCQP